MDHHNPPANAVASNGHLNTTNAQLNSRYTNAMQQDVTCQIGAPPSCFTGDVASRLQTLRMVIEDAGGNLAALSDRLFGAAPRPVPGSSNAPASQGHAADILAVLDSLIEAAGTVRQDANNLNGRI